MELRVFPQLFWGDRSKAGTIMELSVAAVFNTACASSVPAASLLATASAVAATALLLFSVDDSTHKAFSELARFSIVHVAASAFTVAAIHESGHALAAWMLFKDPGIRVIFKGFFQGACTTYTVSYGLTRAGCFFGKEKAVGIVAAGGMAMSTAWAATMVGSCKYLAASQLCHEVSYALQALGHDCSYEHDYARLWMEYELHPLAAVAVMTSVVFSTYCLRCRADV
jgi:hypothetical protein